MRDLLVFAIVMLTLPLSFRRPFIGLLVFSWLAYMRPQDLCWGFARSMRLSFFVGLAMVLGWFATERGWRRFARWDARSWMMVLLAVLVAISYLQAKVHSAYFDRYFFEFLKIIAVALFTTGQVDSRQRLRAMLWTIALCLAFFGVKGGIFGVLTGGATILRGPGGMLEDNNDFALALVMNVPLLWYLGVNERQLPFARLGTLAAVALTVVTVTLTHSRGAFLALAGTALWIAWRSRRLFQAGLALSFCALLFVVLAPQSVLDRLSTIGDTGEASASARLTAWSTALRMIGDNPIWGVGMRNFQPRYKEYALIAPDERTTTYVAHNSYFQIWAESGSLAFAVYLLLLLSVFTTCRRVSRQARLRPDMAWALDYARMLEATTVGFMIGAVFLNRGHFDLVYHWFSLATCLGAVAFVAFRQEPAAADGAAPAAATAASARPQIRRREGAATPVLAAGRPRPRWGRST